MSRVIGVSGPPGAGKSSLVELLGLKLNTNACLHIDHYQTLTDNPLEEVANWINNGSDYAELSFPDLESDLQTLKDGHAVPGRVEQSEVKPDPYILFETHFGRAHEQSGKFIDTLVWIDTPMDLALARNIKSFMQSFLSEQSPGDYKNKISWLDEYMDNYIKHVRTMLVAQRALIIDGADIVLDGSDTVEAMVAQVINGL